MKVLCFTLLFKIILCCAATAQVRKITGLVSFNNERQGGVIIKDISTHTQAISNDIGEFTIPAQRGDTITAVKEEFRDTLLVTEVPYFVIKLKKSPAMLKEVVVNSTALSPAKKLEENKKDYHEIYRIGDNKKIIGPDNIDKIWSAVSREGKNARKLQRNFTTGYKNSIIDRRFNKILVGRITGYRGLYLSGFMDKYRPSFEMAETATDYELIKYIQAKLKEDKKSN